MAPYCLGKLGKPTDPGRSGFLEAVLWSARWAVCGAKMLNHKPALGGVPCRFCSTGSCSGCYFCIVGCVLSSLDFGYALRALRQEVGGNDRRQIGYAKAVVALETLRGKCNTSRRFGWGAGAYHPV